jgi:lysozyme family protein
MKHPFEILKPEYSQLLSAMVIRPESREAIDHVAVKLLGYKTRYEPVTAATGVPIVFIGPSFEREASSNFKLNAGQGWPLTSISKWVPYNGPFRTWADSAIAAYHLNGLDRVGAGNWTWELICFYGELFNGMGYRDAHHMHTPYLWGGTNIQTRGKYVKDRDFDPSVMDTQLGIIPVARRMAEIDPTVALSGAIAIPPPVHSGIAAPDSGGDTVFVQKSMNRLGWQPPLAEDGSYGDQTKKAVEHFQRNFGLKVDFAGPETVTALKAAIAAIEESEKQATAEGKPA